MNISKKYEEQFRNLIELQQTIRHIHPLLHRYYPVAIIEDGNINVFDYDNAREQYDLVHVEEDKMNIPKGVRAAFPLEGYGHRCVVVVSGEVFDHLAAQVDIFHENVHCFQYETCENKLRSHIELARTSVNTDTYFWELHYPFPYHDACFVKYAGKSFQAMTANDREGLRNLRKGIKAYLGKEQAEYMVWQEWKEGYARYIENAIKRELQVKENRYGVNPPYGRPIFYELGSQLTSFLQRNRACDPQDIEQLYHIMNEDRW